MASSNMKLFLAISAVVLLSHGGGVAEARKFVGVNPFCRTADHKKLCTEMVNGATNIHDASVNAMKHTRDLAARLPELNAVVSQAVKGIPRQVTKDSITQVCSETFSGAAESLDVAIKAYEGGDVLTCLTNLSAVKLEDCSDALKEFGSAFPLKKIAVEFEKYLSNSMAVVEQI